MATEEAQSQQTKIIQTDMKTFETIKQEILRRSRAEKRVRDAQAQLKLDLTL